MEEQGASAARHPSERNARAVDGLRDEVVRGAPNCVLHDSAGDSWPADQLLHEGAAAVAQLVRMHENPTIAVVLNNSRQAMAVVLGAIASGATLVSLPPPFAGQRSSEHLAAISRAARTAGASAILSFDGALEDVPPDVSWHSYDAISSQSGPAADERVASEFTLIQHTSGSTGDPKGVVLSDAALLTNIASTLERLNVEAGDSSCCWLPLSHDMGLVGLFLGAIVAGSPSYAGTSECTVMSPLSFLRSPLTWLELLSERRVTVTAAPDFALRLLLQRWRPSINANLSSLRALILGGETHRMATVSRFIDCGDSVQLSPKALCPAYGFAEAGLAVALTPPGNGPVATQVRFGIDGSHTFEVIASGPPLTGYEVVADGSPLGELRVRSLALATEYVDGTHVADDDGWYQTGDMGIVEDHGVVVVGRCDDTLVSAGRNFSAVAVDDEVERVRGVRAGRACACSLPDGRWMVAAELDRDGRGQPDEVINELRKAAIRACGLAPDVIVVVPPRCLPLTSSGKRRRSQLAAAYVSGVLHTIAHRGDDGRGTP